MISSLLITRGQLRQNFAVKYANLLFLVNQSESWNSSILKNTFITLLFMVNILTLVKTCEVWFKTMKVNSYMSLTLISARYYEGVPLFNCKMHRWVDLSAVLTTEWVFHVFGNVEHAYVTWTVIRCFASRLCDAANQMTHAYLITYYDFSVSLPVCDK